MGWVLQNAIFKKVEYFTIFQFTFKKCRNGELLYMKNLSVFILARTILFCSIILQHAHVLLHLTAPVRFDYGYRREGDHGNLTCSKRVRYFCCWRKGGISSPSQSITVPTWSEKNGGKCIRDIHNHLLSISLIVIKYKIIHYTEVPRINIH
jgi:hypothetical protein